MFNHTYKKINRVVSLLQHGFVHFGIAEIIKMTHKESVVMQEHRYIGVCNTITVKSHGKVRYQQSERISVSIETENDVLPYLCISVENETLNIEMSDDELSHANILITVSGPRIDCTQIDSCTIADAFDVTAEAIHLKDCLKTSVSKRVRRLAITASGISKTDVFALSAEIIRLNIAEPTKVNEWTHQKDCVIESGISKITISDHLHSA